MNQTILIRDDAGRPLSASVYLMFDDIDGESQTITCDIGARGKLVYDGREVDVGTLALVLPNEEGFWSSCAEQFDRVDEIVCDRLPQTRSSNWWHALLGERISHTDRGARIRVGVIDAGFEPDAGLAHVQMLEVPEEPSYAPPLRWGHGEAVCRILADRTAPEDCAPIAPGADVVFASASFTRTTTDDEDFLFPVADAVEGDHLDPRLVANAIYEMTYGWDVDLINLSLGVFDEAGEGLGVAEAINAAVAAGVTVICAAGNEPLEEVAFPARHAETIAIGAIGARGWGGRNSTARLYDDRAQALGMLQGREVFHWCDSAFGPDIDAVAPGVGILIARDGRPAFDLSGTSFAAPIVTGLLAVDLDLDDTYLSLPRDRERTLHVRRRLLALCKPVGLDADLQGAGVPILP